MQLAPEFVSTIYRELHADLRQFDDAALHAHYLSYGRAEGRRANELRSRLDFIEQIPPDRSALEIGPFNRPLLAGPTVRYCDVFGQQQLRDRAAEIGFDPSSVPQIHYVLAERGLTEIRDRFHAVLSSHNIEHQTDLVEHLQQVERLLDGPEAGYFLLVPDKRYCFDHFIAPSTIAEVLEAHEIRRTRHTLRSVIEHRALTTHNDCCVHWGRAADRSPESAPAANAGLVRAAIEEWRNARGAYLDVHAWYFTPDSFSEILCVLRELGLTRLALDVVYPTRRDCNEFWVVLRRQ